ncbi:MAG TPA: hypothetical protein VM056_00760 [Terriglobales bacterium]|nr:hypothetical protein [Terriglobales bacterium]
MELLEGDTLDRRILHQRLTLDAMLDLWRVAQTRLVAQTSPLD